MYALAHAARSRSRPTTSASIPTARDAWGLPAICVTFVERENDQRLYRSFQDRNLKLLRGRGVVQRWEFPLDAYLPRGAPAQGPAGWGMMTAS